MAAQLSRFKNFKMWRQLSKLPYKGKLIIIKHLALIWLL